MEYYKYIAPYHKKNYEKLDEQNIQMLISEEMKEAILQNYKFTYYELEKQNITSIEIFTDTVLELLNMFQSKYIGTFIEDNVWSIYKNSTERFDVEEGDILLVNTTAPNREYDSNTIFFMDTIINKLKNISEILNIDWDTFRCYDDNITWIMIWISEITPSSDNSSYYDDEFDDSNSDVCDTDENTSDDC